MFDEDWKSKIENLKEKTEIVSELANFLMSVVIIFDSFFHLVWVILLINVPSFVH